jgi:hypothetical protein
VGRPMTTQPGWLAKSLANASRQYHDLPASLRTCSISSARSILIERAALSIADQVVPTYRAPNARHTGCSSHTAKRWQAAYDAARIALGNKSGTVEP